MIFEIPQSAIKVIFDSELGKNSHFYEVNKWAEEWPCTWREFKFFLSIFHFELVEWLTYGVLNQFSKADNIQKKSLLS